MPTLVSLLIILGLSALNVSKVALQTTFGRRRMQTTADTVLYNLYMFLFAAVIPGLLLSGGGQISPLTAAAGSASRPLQLNSTRSSAIVLCRIFIVFPLSHFLLFYDLPPQESTPLQQKAPEYRGFGLIP